MKILFVCNSSWGIYNFRRAIISEFIRRGIEVVAVAPSDGFAGKLEELGCRFVSVPMEPRGYNPAKDIVTLLALLRIYQSERPDTIFQYTIKANIYGSIAARLCGLASVAVVTGLGSGFIAGGPRSSIVRQMYRVGMSAASRAWFLNSDDKDLFIREGLVAPGKVDVLPGEGIDMNYFAPRPRNQGDSRFRFLMVGRLLWDKGVAEYVAAARIVRARRPDVIFQLLGSANSLNPTAVGQEQVDAWVEEGIVEYLGHSTDVRAHIARSDCIVLPSYREGLPLTLLEASSMAKPLIATDVAGCRDIVSDGRNGLLCAPRDSESLADRCLQMVDIGREGLDRMGNVGRAIVAERFEQSLIVRQYESVIRELAPSNHMCFRPVTLREGPEQGL